MKQGIHPDYHEIEVHCACGNNFKTKSTKEEIRIEICSECHPFFTGQVKQVERGGRADKFKEKYGLK
ncbi:50S ribosomal protein L31 [Fusibacter ferrireducens]|uniref:Large ribosomal subunit protein bL31 n=1 Tax=Fusibacter ferrireducens TaxID=2785058 RepID=A0ABR9ZVW0_9FIRM|nr:50S ribosomal protein L31 [Fusibacter ferrireducens]MBF4694565.1 50S ribosomal protein L31 [Fusibacter ferrireducens]